MIGEMSVNGCNAKEVLFVYLFRVGTTFLEIGVGSWGKNKNVNTSPAVDIMLPLSINLYFYCYYSKFIL